MITIFPQSKGIFMVVIGILMVCSVCQNTNCEQNQEKLYMLQIIQVPNSYANGRTIYTKQQIVFGIQNNFIQIVNGMNFLFRNGNHSNLKTPSSKQTSTPTYQQNIPVNPPVPASNPSQREEVAPPISQQIIPPTNRPTIPPSNRPQNLPPAQQNDFSSNGQVTNDPGLRSSVQSQRSYLLYRLNKMRGQVGASPLSLDDDLNEIAQRHSDDMTRRGYFSHNTPQGVTPQMRAQSYGFCCPVGENLARATSLAQAHERLRASEGHYRNSISRSWQRAGFGLSLRNGELFLTVLFSGRDFETDAVSSSEFARIKEGFINIIIRRNPSIFTEITALSSDIDVWMRTDRSINLMTYLRRKRYMNLLYWKRVMTSFDERVYEGFANDNALLAPNSNYRKVGIGMMVDENGLLDIYIVYSS